MAELLLAVEQQPEPPHSARDNLVSLAPAFAASASSLSGRSETSGEVRSLPS